MNEQPLGPLISGTDIASELRRRKSKDIFQTIKASTKKLVAEKVKLEEQDGWRVVKKNAKSTRMAKPKPSDEQLEDEVWSILAQMGFKEMSKGRHFKISVGQDVEPRQIDVFAKDDESVIIVECTQSDTPGKKRMEKLIEKIKAIREPVMKSIRKTFEQQSKLKIKFAIATRNISWSEADLTKCREAQISVISDGELDYYAELVKHLKHAARYQFLGHMFGGQKIDGLARQVVATRGKMGGETFYTFLIPPDELLKIAYVGHKASRDIENLETYQRMLQPRRLKKIAQYINDAGKFPTNIVVNLKTARKTGLKFDLKEKYGDEALGVLHLPPNYASAWIIDGQHRLYGYAYARETGGYNHDATVLPVLAYENLPAEKEMNLFIDINSKQVKVSTGLLVELYSDLHWKSEDPEEAFQALLSRIASRLNSDRTSPLFDRMVVTGKKKTHYRCLTQTSIRDGLKVAKLVGALSKGTIVPGPLSTAGASAYDANLKKSMSVISDCLRMFSREMPDHWKTGDGTGGYLCTNIGIRALFHVVRDIADHIHQTEGTDLYLLNSDETFSAIEPYLQELVNYFKGASSQDIRAFRLVGSSLTAVRQQAYGMEAQIHKKRRKFLPVGLKNYLEARDEEGTEEAAKKVRRINDRLFKYIIGKLKEKYGNAEDKWWTEGVPPKIRKKCALEWEDRKREGNVESYLYLRDYVDICIHNWDMVQDVISLNAKDKMAKTQNVKWINELNSISQKTKHPEKGPLSAEQVARVNELYDLVQEHFPA